VPAVDRRVSLRLGAMTAWADLETLVDPHHFGSARTRRFFMNSFSHSIDIKRFQNLLDTSVDETERQTIQRLLTDERDKAALQALEAKKN
jgi:hypothetical protein